MTIHEIVLALEIVAYGLLFVAVIDWVVWFSKAFLLHETRPRFVIPLIAISAQLTTSLAALYGAAILRFASNEGGAFFWAGFFLRFVVALGIAGSLFTLRIWRDHRRW